MSKALKRIEKELTEFNKYVDNDEYDGFTAGPIDDSNMFEWEASIPGPEYSLYEGGTFQLKILFPRDYPFKPPELIFQTKIYHPNFRKDGSICCHALDILKDLWSPDITILRILKAIQWLLKNPNFDRACGFENVEVAEVYKKDRRLFEETAREWTEKYASN